MAINMPTGPRSPESYIFGQTTAGQSVSQQPAAIMSKRAANTFMVGPNKFPKTTEAAVCQSSQLTALELSIRPAKSSKMDSANLRSDDVWDLIPGSDGSTQREDFKAVEGEPKLKLLKSFTLSYSPKVSVCVTLNGPNPEVRFTSEDGCFSMSGDEFVTLTGTHLGDRADRSFQRVRLEALEDDSKGFRLARYARTSSGMSELNPSAVFELSQYAAKSFKSKVGDITSHVVCIMRNEEVILGMFWTILPLFKTEYVRLNSLKPMTEHFHELSRIVECYVPGSVIVRSFLERLHREDLVSSFNHYNLLATVFAQKDCLELMVSNVVI